jgi:iron complex transport system ATP-binding protein
METLQTFTMSAHPSIELRNLSLGYPGKSLLNNVSLSIEPGVLTSLQGRNGTGKSSLLRCIAGLAKPNSGDVFISNHSIYELKPLERSRLIGTLWTDKIRLPGLTLRDLVWMGTYNARTASKSADLNSITDECIDRLSLKDLAQQPLDQLSDGELQKGMIARALAQKPAFLLLDEPTTYLDYVAKEELMQTLLGICRNNGPGILFTSHDLDIIGKHAQCKLELKNNCISTLG